MNINRVIKNEMDKSNGKLKIVSCKKNIVLHELIKLENEIKSGIIQNKAMEERTINYAEQGPVLRKKESRNIKNFVYRI